MSQTESISVGDALFGKTRQKVLGLLYGKPDQSFFTNEIVRLAGGGKGGVMRELETLREAGLVTATRRGNQLHYQANQQSPVFNELAGIVRKTFGLVDVIRHALLPLAGKIRWAFIYGSMAKNQATATSDIDLMLVGEDLAYSTVMEWLAPAEQALGRTINPTLYTPDDLAGKIAAGNAFVVRVLEQPKMNVIGQEP